MLAAVYIFPSSATQGSLTMVMLLTIRMGSNAGDGIVETSVSSRLPLDTIPLKFFTQAYNEQLVATTFMVYIPEVSKPGLHSEFSQDMDELVELSLQPSSVNDKTVNWANEEGEILSYSALMPRVQFWSYSFRMLTQEAIPDAVMFCPFGSTTVVAWFSSSCGSRRTLEVTSMQELHIPMVECVIPYVAVNVQFPVGQSTASFQSVPFGFVSPENILPTLAASRLNKPAP
jgi:hypothetical protein